jgi:cytochrome c
MTRLLAGSALVALALLSACAPAAARAQSAAAPAAAGVFTAAQAEAGKKVFEASCARCHLSDLTGKDDAPPLGGAYFTSSWGGHKVSELLEFVRVNMPYDEPATLDDESYLRVVAYLLSRNGAPSGATPLAKDVSGTIPTAKD